MAEVGLELQAFGLSSHGLRWLPSSDLEVVGIRQGHFLSSWFFPRLLFSWNLLEIPVGGLFNQGCFWALAPYLPQGPHSPFTVFSTASPLLVLLAHSKADFLARRRSGCPHQLFIPSPEPGGHRCCQQEAASFQVTAREMGPFPPPPPFPGLGLVFCQMPGPTGRCRRWGGSREGQRGAFPGPRGAGDGRCDTSHHSRQPVSWGPLVLPCPAPGAATILGGNGDFSAGATQSTPVPDPLTGAPGKEPRLREPHTCHLPNGLLGGS